MPKFQLPRDPSSELIRQQLDVMKQAHIEAGPPSGEIRKDRIDRAIALLRAHAEAFCDAVSADFGNRSRQQSMLADIYTSIDELRFSITNCPAETKEETRLISDSAASRRSSAVPVRAWAWLVQPHWQRQA